MLPCKLTGGSCFIRCAWTASRPVYISPLAEHHIANSQAANLLFADRGLKPDFLPSSREAVATAHGHRRLVIPIQPAFDSSRPGVENNAEAPKSPAVIGTETKKLAGSRF